MQISTNQFLLGSLGDLLAQETNIGQLNHEIATGETMLDATGDPAGAATALGLASGISRLSYDGANAGAATQQIQNALGALQQVSTVIDQLRQAALTGANSGNSAATTAALVATAQSGLQQLVQLANSQDPAGRYVFAGTTNNAAPFQSAANGQIVYTGDGGANWIEVGPSLTVQTSVSGNGIFSDIPAGENGIAVTAGVNNTGSAYAAVEGITSESQVTTDRLAGAEYEIAFSSGSGGMLNYTVSRGIGTPGTAGFSASAATVAWGSLAAGQDLQTGGVDLRIIGTPAAGDSFAIAPGATSSLFATVQGLISALQAGSPEPQPIENAIANLDGAQQSVQAAQATLGANLAEITGVQSADGSAATQSEVQLSQLQSADLPQVLANYSESVTALQAAMAAFAKIANLSLFSVLQ